MFKLYLGVLLTAIGLFLYTGDTFYYPIMCVTGGYILMEGICHGLRRKNK
jgi:hypothetical protein